MPDTPECLTVPPYPTGAGPGCILWGDGEHLHWSDPPTAPQQVPTWSGSEWVPANPAGESIMAVPVEQGPKPREVPDKPPK